MQHTPVVVPLYGYSHHQPNALPPQAPPVLDLCTNSSYFDSCSACPTSLSTSSRNSGIPSTSKPLRPFKAISRRNLEFHHFLYNDSAFQEYRNRILPNVSLKNELCTSMRRSQGSTNEIKNPEYIAKRKKNNEAAKRSREARKMKEDEIALRCAFLEQENLQLKIRLSALESEARRLQSLLFYPISDNAC